MKQALAFVSQFSDIVSILVVPLIICPVGLVFINRFSALHNIEVQPVLPLVNHAFIPQTPVTNESAITTKLRDLANATYMQVTDNQPPGHINPTTGKLAKPYWPLGWDKTGGLVVMHTNTPDNTLPMFHWESTSWKPIFPRHSRN